MTFSWGAKNDTTKLSRAKTVSRAQNNILNNGTHVGAAFSQPGSRRPSDYKKILPNAEALSDLEESPALSVDADPSRPGWTACVSACFLSLSLSLRLSPAVFWKTTFYASTRTARRGQTKPWYNGTFIQQKTKFPPIIPTYGDLLYTLGKKITARNAFHKFSPTCFSLWMKRESQEMRIGISDFKSSCW